MTLWGRAAPVAVGMLLAAVLTGCTAAADEPQEAATATPAPAVETPEPTAEPTAEVLSASDGFLAWLDASREPDSAVACAGLTDELAQRMISQLNESGLAAVSTCEEMISMTAEAYRALGQSADVDIEVREETAADAVLFVTYAAGGDCGTVVMDRVGDGWVINELSEECAA